MKLLLPLNYTITSLSLLLLLTACNPDVKPTVTYEEKIKESLKLSHVFVPPSDAYPPYTLLHYLKGEGFQQVCEASEVTGIAEENLSKKLVSKNISNSTVDRSYNINYGVNLLEKGVNYAGISYQNIKKVVITLKNGKIISMPSVHISDVNRTLSTGKCAEDIKFFKHDNPNSKFYIPREVYQYSMRYSILDKDGVDITAKLPKNLQRVILSNAGIDINKEDVMTMDGDDLYIGFKGAAISKGIRPKRIEPKSFIDVTSLVKSIK
jgi:hypothetical protein